MQRGCVNLPPCLALPLAKLVMSRLRLLLEIPHDQGDLSPGGVVLLCFCGGVTGKLLPETSMGKGMATNFFFLGGGISPQLLYK